MAYRDHTLHAGGELPGPHGSPTTHLAIEDTEPSFPPPAYLNTSASANDESLPMYEQSPLFPAYNSGKKQHPRASDGDIEAQQQPPEHILAHDEAQGAQGASKANRVERRVQRQGPSCCWWAKMLLPVAFLLGLYLTIFLTERSSAIATKKLEDSLAQATAKVG
ncbi:hypothetical protein LTR10_003576 [Elasticomyces elasticus]|nr:hypothetical protein LTR10_003576 [Elasticomyces elasticus]KAK4978228.1 hypothetical protein LTR42_002606 [Elasticomyces elasticus]